MDILNYTQDYTLFLGEIAESLDRIILLKFTKKYT